MGGGAVFPEGLDRATPSPPIGGQLALFSVQWESSTSDSWVLHTVSLGFSLKFISPPPPLFLACPGSQDRSKRDLLSAAIAHLLLIEAIQEVPQSQRGQGFYSRLFLVKKSSGGWKAILDP